MTEVSVFQALQWADQCFRNGQLNQAEQLYRKVLSVDPQNAMATHGMGVIALRVNRPDVAIDLLIKSTAQLANHPLAHCALADALLALGRIGRAIESYQRALALKPDFADAWCNLGTAFQESGRFDEAIGAFCNAIELAPTLMGPHNNLGNVLRLEGKYEEAIGAYQRAIALQPDLCDTQNHLAGALMESGRIDEAITTVRKALQCTPISPGAHSNLLAFLPCDPNSDPQAIFDEHRRWNQLHAAPPAREIFAHNIDRSSDRRLRIGYVSPDWRDHPISYFMQGLLGSHDREHFEVICYADLDRAGNQDADRLRELAGQWRNITGLGDQRVAEMIHNDRIDILVDLSGHTAGNRLLVFARKPAPVQVTYLGYPNTTGLDAIDYRLTDAMADPPGQTERFHSEQLVRLPRAFACYTAWTDAPAVSNPPSASSGAITFGSFNKLSKINREVIACWATILKQSPGSRLLMLSHALQDAGNSRRFIEAFAAHGVDAGRLEFRGNQSRANYFAAHHLIDLMLDPFPVNGHTITCHSLWMGVPVISLTGQAHISRLGTSVLHSLGLAELAVPTVEEYIRLATQLAANPTKLAEYRAGMRQRLMASPLLDHAGFARSGVGVSAHVAALVRCG